MLPMLLPMMAQTTAPEWAAHLERIMWAQLITAGVMVICAVAVLAAAAAVFVLVRRAMDRVDAAKSELLPHVTPVLSRAATIADDVGHITAGFRDNADDVQETVNELLNRSRVAVDSLDERVRRFGAVLEAVQIQAEELMMDVAATARGAHATARALHDDTPGRRQTGRRPDHDRSRRDHE